MLAPLPPSWDHLGPFRGPWWCFVCSVRGTQLQHRQEPTRIIPPKRSPPWPSSCNRRNSENQPKNKISSGSQNTTKNHQTIRLQKANQNLELYESDVFVEMQSVKARAPIARPAPTSGVGGFDFDLSCPQLWTIAAVPRLAAPWAGFLELLSMLEDLKIWFLAARFFSRGRARWERSRVLQTFSTKFMDQKHKVGTALLDAPAQVQ